MKPTSSDMFWYRVCAVLLTTALALEVVGLMGALAASLMVNAISLWSIKTHESV